MLLSSHHKLVSLALKKEKSVIQINDISIGGKKAIMMAGPCAIESLEQLISVGCALKKLGVSILRGSAYSNFSL